MTATAFKAKCLEVMDRVNAGAWARIVITNRGKDVAGLLIGAGWKARGLRL